MAADVVRGYGVTTAQLKDWSHMTNAIGVQMEFTGTDNSVGVFMRDVAGSQLGDKVDIFIFESGTEDILGPQGMYLVIDEKHPELTLWDRSPDEWKHSEVVMGKDGKQYGVPVIGNADSFGYFPDAIGANPDGTDDISWEVFFESDKTRGKVAYDQTWTYSLGPAALYLQAKGKAQIQDIADMTREEAKTVVDFLIERKKAGQFRTLHSAFEEQVQLLTNKEVGHHQLLGAGDPRGEPQARPRHGALRLHRRRLFQVGPRRLHRVAGGRPRQSRRDLQGAELFPRRRISRAAGARPRLCRAEHGSRRGICDQERLVAGGDRCAQGDRRKGRPQVQEAVC